MSCPQSRREMCRRKILQFIKFKSKYYCLGTKACNRAVVQWRTSEFEMESTGKCTRQEFVGGSGSRAPFILNLGIRWRLVAKLRPQPLNSREKGPGTHWVGWASEPVWTRYRTEKWLAISERGQIWKVPSKWYWRRPNVPPKTDEWDAGLYGRTVPACVTTIHSPFIIS